MEEDEIQALVCKFPRVANGRNEDIGEVRRRGSDGESTNRFHSWNHSSRIIRVSRASGGKDRHSKVMTSKGLRDRRVRLSVTTAIQFYDLQDRLGYDQPSKAVEWLIKSAADAIAELPSLNTFPYTPKSDDKRATAEAAGVHDDNVNENGNGTFNQQNDNNNHNDNKSQNMSLSKSACSSTSETSKGSGLSLSRSDIRVKARERARERTTKEKEKENEKENNESQHNVPPPHDHRNHHDVNPISQTASFTELLTGGIGNAVPTTASPKGCDEPNMMFDKAGRQQWCSSATMDYFLGPSSSRTNHHHQYSSSTGFSLAQIQLGHSLPEALNNNVSAAFNNVSGENHHHSLDPQLQQHFSFIPDHHLMSAVVTSSSTSHQPSGNDYNLNFTMSSGLAGYNRGTLQSNSPSLLPQLQRFSPPTDGSTVPFFIGAPPPAPAMENNNNRHHHQFSSVFHGSRLQLYYADGGRHSDQKGKTKN